jgi:hypothetical protein
MMVEPQAPLKQPRPGSARAIGFMVGSFFLRLFQFVLIVTGMAVGISTVVIWIGIPILIATTSYVRWSADVERRWVRKALRTPVPDAERLPVDGDGLLRRWQATDRPDHLA